MEPAPRTANIALEQQTRFGPPTFVKKDEGGTIVAFSAGEFGGGLYYYDTAGGHLKTILGDNVNAVVDGENRMLALTERPAGRTLGGYAVEILRKGDRFFTGTLVDLGGSPQAFTSGKHGTVLIATLSGLVSLSEALTILEVVPSRWGAPNSMIELADGTIYVGIPSAVARFTREPNGQLVERWHVAPDHPVTDN